MPCVVRDALRAPHHDELRDSHPEERASSERLEGRNEMTQATLRTLDLSPGNRDRGGWTPLEIGRMDGPQLAWRGVAPKGLIAGEGA